jgi:anhydro-N-acetylmuramic acid kinase
MQKYYALGLMSGSSLDGLDIAYCRFDWDGTTVSSWELLQAETLPYSEIWVRRLAGLPQQNAFVFAQTDVYFGYYMGELVNKFIDKYQISNIDYIASHGHTIFHDPSRRFTVQIGRGAALAATAKKTVIADFRSQDVALDGEGAPLAPLVDAYLFPGYDFYMNIGGIANISASYGGKMIAFDIAPANQVFNFLAEQVGQPYDKDGEIAQNGMPHANFMKDLRDAEHYSRPYPKSIGNEWIQRVVIPMFIASGLPLEAQMATACELLVQETVVAIKRIRIKEQWPQQPCKMLMSGGGTYNTFLIARLREALAKEKIEVIIPDDKIIQFKEALLMGRLGLLRLENVPNSLPSVTGAKAATVNGGIYVSNQ